jgi:isoleucyl-tRNA synthetase
MLRNLKQFSLPEIEEKVLRFWKEKGIKEKSLRSGKKEFVFYEGPPTANGKPGIHHVLARAFKDIVLRYKSMGGYRVLRRAGWDTHGLPVELQVERELGLNSKEGIEKYGIAEFNKRCKESVWTYKGEWERLTERIGFWLDMRDPYITYDNAYIENLWGIVAGAWKKKLLYKGHKVLPWCPRCGTALSSHELAQGYKKITDTSVYVKFKVKEGQKIGGFTVGDSTYILSWTTTPWTLPGNVALAVGEEISYVVVRHEGESFVLAKNRVLEVAGDSLSEPTHEIRGAALVGLEYEPLFSVKKLQDSRSYRVYGADFVNTSEGTGVVHTAVMYGEDDYALGNRVGLPQHHTVDERGRFRADVSELVGMRVRAKETDDAIFKYLDTHGLRLKTEQYSHEYPHCWRCDTALIYYARESWFIAMSRLREKLLRENNRINWIPPHFKEGRFGEWLRGVKDWAISRDRYWGTPLPVWVCSSCGGAEVMGSREALDGRSQRSSNTYLLVRHGGARNNVERFLCSHIDADECLLTEDGRVQVERLGRELKRRTVDVIYASDFKRTKVTAEMLRDALGIKEFHTDPRLREMDFGEFDGEPIERFLNYFSSPFDRFSRSVPGGETLRGVAGRMFDFISEVEKKHSGKTVVIVSHNSPLWMLESVMRGWGEEEAMRVRIGSAPDNFFVNAGLHEVPFRRVPRNEWGLGDMHRPYVDAVTFACSACKGVMERVPQVMDVWFDSGSMPFAAADQYPADYICEAVDQTRGWFYTLLAVAVMGGKRSPYQNVISLGHVLDSVGQKMSKSRGNMVDPWEMIPRYGSDAMRWYFYTVNPPGEPIRFDEGDLKKVSRGFFGLLYNSYVFFDTYGVGDSTSGAKNPVSTHVLDRWIVARLHETIRLVTVGLDLYDVTGSARVLQDFVEDVSRWYIRRSRRRLQRPLSSEDHTFASETLGYVLGEAARLLAPFTPFFAEALYQVLGGEGSVHLAVWPKGEKKYVDQKLLSGMREVRHVAALGLAERASEGVKVRQPLASLAVKDAGFAGDDALLEVLKDEVNVKEVVFDESISGDVVLDTAISHELMEEGLVREFVRMVQGMRQDAGLEPKDKIVVMVSGDDEVLSVLGRNEDFVTHEVGARVVEHSKSSKFDVELETKVQKHPVWIGVRGV